MGIFDGLMGNASELKIEKVQEELSEFLASTERVEKAFKLIRDTIIFTNKRMILIDKQGVTGKKTEFLSIPYKSIIAFSVETAGHFDLEAELKIWISGQEQPIQKTFSRSTNVYEVQRTMAEHLS